MTGALPPLCLTQGDPSGIGPDITLALYAAIRDGRVAADPFFVIGDPAFLARRAALLRLDVAPLACGPEKAASAFAEGLPVAPLAATVSGAPGRPDPADAAATLESISCAVEMVKRGEASAVVTNPIAKSVLYRAGFRPSRPYRISGRAGANAIRRRRPAGHDDLVAQLAVVPATIHVPLARVPSLLSATPGRNRRDRRPSATPGFRRAAPRLAFAGLNPHAGEDGALGREDIELVAPAIARLQRAGRGSRGPLPADTMFHEAARKTYDVAICMYHDQALIPVKTLAFDSGVNVTLGLPFIRTSPDHGTAFSLAGTGKASATSLTEAVLLAGRMARARR